MKSILSPYNDHYFNEFLLKYIKKRLLEKCYKFTKDEEERKYFFEKNSRNYYTPNDIINTLQLNGRCIYFSNQPLINYIVYDLSQRFWYDELKIINNMVHKIYLEYRRFAPAFEIQQRKLSHKKRARQRSQGSRI